MVNTQIKKGDFIRNKIHNYVAFVYGFPTNKQAAHIIDGCYAIMLTESQEATEEQKKLVKASKYFNHVVVLSEVVVEPDTKELLQIAKEMLLHFSSANQLDNLNYIELVDILNKKEAELE